MKFASKITLIFIVVFMTGCAGGLNSMQKREYNTLDYNGALVEEKSPALGAALGILPGFGSFYVGEIGYGIVNLLLWPASALWDPISGYNGAQTINYDLTKQSIRWKQEKEMAALDDKLALGEIDNTQYILAKRKIQKKYSYE